MPKGHSTTKQQKKQAAKVVARERRVRRAQNVLQNNVSPKNRGEE